MTWVLIIFLNGRVFEVDFTSHDRCMAAANSIVEAQDWNSHASLDLVCAER